MSDLGKMEDLPAEYRDALEQQNLTPLWPALRTLLPQKRANPHATACHWSYRNVRPLLLRAGDLAPIEKAERRVLVLRNPSLDPANPAATPAIYLGLQLILPGEMAPNHRHTPSASRLVVEGAGAFTSVAGERLPMEPGDLILTPAQLWHEHGHEGNAPVVWLDALDLPLIYGIGAAYATEGALQNAANVADSSITRYSAAGLLPYEVRSRAAEPFPQMRFPWKRTSAALEALAGSADRKDRLQMLYVNPETGEDCLPTMGFSALMLRPGEDLTLPARSCASVLHIVDGKGTAEVGATSIDWEAHDTIVQPGTASARLLNSSSQSNAFIVIIDEAPLHRKIGIYEEFD